MHLSQWRTVGIVLVGILTLAIGALTIKEIRVFEILKDGIEFLVLVGAGKSTLQHLSSGGGIRGVMANLLTPPTPKAP